MDFTLQDFNINGEPVNFGTISPLARLVLFGESPADIYPKPGGGGGGVYPP